jgi:hypothetical protein
MAEPIDFYSDFASLNVTQQGYTLTFMRSIPQAVEPTVQLPSGEILEPEKSPGPAVEFEIVARVRFGPLFADQLRKLLDRTLEVPTSEPTTVEVTADESAHEVASSSTG